MGKAGRGIRHVRLKRVIGQDYKRRARKSEELNIPLRRRDFRQILSVRFRHPNNIVALEGDAALLLVRWLCRSARNHSKWVPVLIDAQSVLGDVAWPFVFAELEVHDAQNFRLRACG